MNIFGVEFDLFLFIASLLHLFRRVSMMMMKKNEFLSFDRIGNWRIQITKDL
jgi:hypothetical protein